MPFNLLNELPRSTLTSAYLTWASASVAEIRGYDWLGPVFEYQVGLMPNLFEFGVLALKVLPYFTPLSDIDPGDTPLAIPSRTSWKHWRFQFRFQFQVHVSYHTD